jgi:hypothetical protein
MSSYYPPALRPFLESQRGSRSQLLDGPTESAAAICRRSQSTSTEASGAEPISRKERARFNGSIKSNEEAALIEWAQQAGLWTSEADFDRQYSARYIGRGAEQEVFLSYDGRTVVKRNNGDFHGSWLEYFNRLITHSVLFHSTSYRTMGISIVGESMTVITEQPFFVLAHGAPSGAVQDYLTRHGFSRTRYDDYYNATLGIILEDLHDENVFSTEKDHLIFIDPVIYLETADMGLQGKNVFHFPF